MIYSYGGRVDNDSNAITKIDEENRTAETKGYVNGEYVEFSGGGSSDFRIATVTFSGAKSMSFSSAILMGQESMTQTQGVLGKFTPSQLSEVKVILGTQGAVAEINSSQGTISISGDIAHADADTYIITGDCTITVS